MANLQITPPRVGGYVNARDYGAVGDGVTDDTAAIQAAINALPAAGGVVYLPAAVYVVNGTLTSVDKQDVILRGDGAAHNTYQAAPTTGTVLKRVSGTGTLINSGSSATPTTSVRGQGVEDLAIDGNNLAATGILVTSGWGGRYRNLHIRNCTTVALDLTTRDLSSTEDTQDNEFRNISVRQIESASGIGVRLDSWGAGGGNASHNTFDQVVVYHQDGNGFQLNDCDSNVFTHCWTNQTSGAGVGVILNGANHASSGHARANFFFHCQPKSGVTAKATGFTQPSKANLFIMSAENSVPMPTVEAGADLTVLWGDGRSINVRPDARAHSVITDDFVTGNSPATTFGMGDLGWALVAGTGSVTRITSEASRPGIYRIATGTTISNLVWIGLTSNGGLNILPAEAFDMTFIVRLNTNDTDTTVRMGIAGFANSNPANDGIYFEKLAADTSWFGVTRSGASQTRSTAVAATGTGWVRLRLRRKNSTTIAFSVNEGTEQTLTATIPTAGLMVFMHILNATAVDKNIDFDHFQLALTGLSR